MMHPANLLVVAGVGLLAMFVIAISPLEQHDGESFDVEPGIEVEPLTKPVVRSEVASQMASSAADDSKASEVVAELHPVRIRRPEGPPRVELLTDGPQGRVSQVACPTCHSIREPNYENTQSSALDEFHQGLQVNHGKLACYACHNPEDTNSLRTADGNKIAFQNVMSLCSQCHSPQADSFAHGAHGGMNGFWDLSRGPQIRNNCIDCHDPHAPRYPRMIVTFKPRDRFLEGDDSHDEHE